MSKVAVVFWSGTGNTGVMATNVAEGAKEAGAQADVIFVSDFSALSSYQYLLPYENLLSIKCQEKH